MTKHPLLENPSPLTKAAVLGAALGLALALVSSCWPQGEPWYHEPDLGPFDFWHLTPTQADPAYHPLDGGVND